MESYIPHFQNEEREKNSDIIVTINGPSGAGKGTIAQHVSEKLDLTSYSAGDFFRKLAKEKGLTVEELSEQADKATDIKVDRRTLEKGLNEDSIIESRISSWVLGDYADLKIYVTADIEERAKRVMNDLKNGSRVAEQKNGSGLEEVKQRIKKRDEHNKRRYKNYYNIDMDNLEIYDIIIDNTDLSIEEQKEMIDKALEKRLGVMKNELRNT